MKTKLKMGMLPGDVGKSEKIRMLEKRHNKRARSFVKEVLMNERAVLKERTEKEIEECLESTTDVNYQDSLAT